jgi:hypothetical protein
VTRIAIVFSNQEPYLNLVDDMSRIFGSRGLAVEQVMIETAALPLSRPISAVLVMSNIEEAWRFSAAAIGRGTILCNGDIRACYLERRLWKTYITRMHPAFTPQWISTTSPAQLMHVWPREWFPAFLKPGDSSSGRVVRVADQGDLADRLASSSFTSSSILLERSVSDSEATMKVYSIGDQHRAFEYFEDRARRSLPMNSKLLELTRLAQDSSGLRVLSFDYKVDEFEQPQIIDINRFPVFQAWPEAKEIIADYVVTSLQWAEAGLDTF